MNVGGLAGLLEGIDDVDRRDFRRRQASLSFLLQANGFEFYRGRQVVQARVDDVQQHAQLGLGGAKRGRRLREDETVVERTSADGLVGGLHHILEGQRASRFAALVVKAQHWVKGTKVFGVGDLDKFGYIEVDVYRVARWHQLVQRVSNELVLEAEDGDRVLLDAEDEAVRGK